MEEWCQSWIKTAGLNSIEADLDTHQIKQCYTVPGFETLRSHKMKVAGFKADNSFEVIDLVVRGPTTKMTFKEPSQIVGVLLNYEDWSFVKIILDQKSNDFFLGNLDQLVLSDLNISVLLKAFDN